MGLARRRSHELAGLVLLDFSRKVYRPAVHHRGTENTEVAQRKLPRGDTMTTPINSLTHEVIGASIEVHRKLGPGLLESAYKECLCRELVLRGIPFERERPLPLEYKAFD
jgi:hypothetical protein